MIRLENIEKTYYTGGVHTPVLRDLSFSVEQGEYVAIMGPSGSGKTTLMNILGCLDRPTAGEYVLEGTDTGSLADTELSRLRNNTIGFVFQLFHLLPRTTVLRNVLLPLIYAPEYPSDAEQRAGALLESMGLGGRIGYQPNTLSGGEQQRVAIARALINDPPLLLADEPTGNLDSASGAEVLDIIGRLHGQGRTIVMITHDPRVAERAQRVLRLEDGRITGEQRQGGGGSAGEGAGKDGGA